MHNADKGITNEEIEKKVKEILANKLKIDTGEIKRESILDKDLGMDSFASVEIMFEIENKFDIDIPQKEILNINTVEGIIDYIAKRIKSNALS